MKLSFEIICSAGAAAILSEAECRDIVDSTIPMAREKDRGVHEGLAFSFDRHGKEWQIIVDLQEAWVKIMGKGEYDKAVKDAVQVN